MSEDNEGQIKAEEEQPPLPPPQQQPRTETADPEGETAAIEHPGDEGQAEESKGDNVTPSGDRHVDVSGPPPPPLEGGMPPGSEDDRRWRSAPPGYAGGPMHYNQQQPPPPMPPRYGYPPPPGHHPNYPMYPPMYPYQQPPYGPPYHHMPPYGYDPHQHPRYDGEEGKDGDPMMMHHGYGMPPDSRQRPAPPPSAARTRAQQEILDRRARKNAQSRARASKLRDRISEVKEKAEEELTEEERELMKNFEERRQRKNDRSRERAIEKKTEMERILAKPEKKRTRHERAFLETALKAKQRKNEGDRIRRQRIKQMGINAKARANARERGHAIPIAAAIPPHHHGSYSQSGSGGLTDIPMSPLPSSVPPHQQSPAAAFGSPGLMPNIRFPSPPNTRSTASGGTPGVVETPGGTSGSGNRGGGYERQPPGSGPLPFMPNQPYDQRGSPQSRSQLHLPQNSSRVEQRRYPDGSMTIQIGRQSGEGEQPAFGGEEGGDEHLGGGLEGHPPPDGGDGQPNLSDVSHLLNYNDDSNLDAPGGNDGIGNGSNNINDDQTEQV